ncbi:hypothetical protein GCM10018781_56990 [Kitasatospora indigofera]|uniref:SseB protein N-terminal domain-containing protein n=1 Tax=Kitasatospora indigofera TaxID=67307 RepID=A0A919G8M6_9ACTN|nr:hypothetical protein [Kitasatospora indigofera]GHH79290.1 hypothetical protein GCM10018781_56990 [Kitasatospora indigofera]
MIENPNVRLADLLDRRAEGHEPAPQAVLAALSEGGMFVPVTHAGAVLFLPDDEQPPTLLGFTDAALGTRLLPAAAGMVHCDLARLRDILEKTGVAVLGVRSGDGQAIIPEQALRDWATHGPGPGAEMTLSWSTDPVAVALRDALVRRIREFPAVRSVWVAQVRWQAGGEEHLMLHVAVDEDLPSASADRLLQTLLREEVKLGSHHPKVGMIALNTTTHAEHIDQLDHAGLDTVRHDVGSGQVRVISREYDDPKPAPADGAGPRPRAKRPWFGRS